MSKSKCTTKRVKYYFFIHSLRHERAHADRETLLPTIKIQVKPRTMFTLNILARRPMKTSALSIEMLIRIVLAKPRMNHKTISPRYPILLIIQVSLNYRISNSCDLLFIISEKSADICFGSCTHAQ